MMFETREEKMEVIKLKLFEYQSKKPKKDPYARLFIAHIAGYYTNHNGIGEPIYTVVRTIDGFEWSVENTVEQIDKVLGVNFV